MKPKDFKWTSITLIGFTFLNIAGAALSFILFKDNYDAAKNCMGIVCIIGSLRYVCFSFNFNERSYQNSGKNSQELPIYSGENSPSEPSSPNSATPLNANSNYSLRLK
ncbi:hypothetical protein BCR36DRAFT_588571 [Piromyces finnis]|uniref:Uncharacterized protein n=1 Tax=Piromyces finnis TaxID=1754191 RepID=A0A1Y1U7V2_9FUNG|nr:hypothetical protein BCR36DRAFT_588571 [Piromyces finnis]|eukprot:ORX34088.1 hypothetical protein BCR36DRAFT_588571 [Piromyces finnis]